MGETLQATWHLSTTKQEQKRRAKQPAAQLYRVFICLKRAEWKRCSHNCNSIDVLNHLMRISLPCSMNLKWNTCHTLASNPPRVFFSLKASRGRDILAASELTKTSCWNRNAFREQNPQNVSERRKLQAEGCYFWALMRPRRWPHLPSIQSQVLQVQQKHSGSKTPSFWTAAEEGGVSGVDKRRAIGDGNRRET